MRLMLLGVALVAALIAAVFVGVLGLPTTHHPCAVTALPWLKC